MTTVGCVDDIETMIKAFLEDSACTSLELAHMTTGQRKHAKRVADQNPELTCESYGFGQERRLHLFKKTLNSATVIAHGSSSVQEIACASSTQAVGSPGEAVTVKNTFIDDWVDSADGGESREPIIFRSMPTQLSGISPAKLAEATHILDLSPIKEAAENEDDTVGASTAASGVDSSPTLSSTPPSTDFEADAALPEVSIKNTFIHLRGMTLDERIVQSMPHGMFKRSLIDELHMQEKSVANCEAQLCMASNVENAVPPAEHKEVKQAIEHIAAGLEVVIEGLLKAPAFNGRHGVVQSYDQDSERYSISLSCTKGTEKHQIAKVKRENLRLAIPPPPQFAPSITVDEHSLQGVEGCVPSTPEWGDRILGVSPLKLTALVC